MMYTSDILNAIAGSIDLQPNDKKALKKILKDLDGQMIEDDICEEVEEWEEDV